MSKDSGENPAEDYSTYSDAEKIGGPKHVLKRTMRGNLITFMCPKIGLKVIGWLGMRLNYQRLSSFGRNIALLWQQVLHRSLNSLVVKIYTQGRYKVETLLIAFKTDYKRSSLINNLRVLYATGEIPSYLRKYRRDDRGSVVAQAKGPKNLALLIGSISIPKGARLYSTKSRIKRSVPVQEQRELSQDIKILAKHWKTCQTNSTRVFNDLKGYLKNESLWFAAYIRLARKKGSFTPGPDYENVKSLTKKRILEVRQTVLDETYEWVGTRRLQIPKPGKPGKTRPLGIPAINDRLVQEVIRSIIEPIFEPQFSNISFGFRPGRGCHTALKWINTNMKDSIWYIEGDIKSYFDKIDHDKLMELIKRRVTD